MSVTNIGIHNFQQPGFNALQFSLMGMTLVFGGLLIIALYIYLLPKLLALGERQPKRKKSQCNSEKCKQEEEEILLAIATALHLHCDFPEGEDRITWKSHGDMESPWLVSGRLRSLKNRQQVNPWNM